MQKIVQSFKIITFFITKSIESLASASPLKICSIGEAVCFERGSYRTNKSPLFLYSEMTPLPHTVSTLFVMRNTIKRGNNAEWGEGCYQLLTAITCIARISKTWVKLPHDCISVAILESCWVIFLHSNVCKTIDSWWGNTALPKIHIFNGLK